jgi:hypothetical protein
MGGGDNAAYPVKGGRYEKDGHNPGSGLTARLQTGGPRCHGFDFLGCTE